MHLIKMNIAVLPCLLVAMNSTIANATTFKGDACAEQHAYSSVPQEVTESLDDDTLNWQQARAEYLRSLDYEKLNSHYPMADDYNAKRDLIEAKYHMALAESEINEADDMSTGQSELKVASCYIDKAMANTDSDDQHQIRKVKSDLNKLSLYPQKDLHYCSDKQFAMTRFHDLENEVGTMLQAL